MSVVQQYCSTNECSTTILYTYNTILTDVDECQSPDLCGHDCINTNGSYYCTCEEESVLATDQSSCIGET